MVDVESVFDKHCGKGVEVDLGGGDKVRVMSLLTEDYPPLISIVKEFYRANKEKGKDEGELDPEVLPEAAIGKLGKLVEKSVRRAYPLIEHPRVTDEKISELCFKFFKPLMAGLFDACGMTETQETDLSKIEALKQRVADAKAATVSG